MTHAGKYHGNIVFICSCDYFIISDRTTRLDDRTYTDAGSRINAVAKWKKSIISLVEEGKAEGVIDMATNAQNMAEILIAIMEGGSVLSKVTGEESYMLNAIDTAEKIITDMQQKV